MKRKKLSGRGFTVLPVFLLMMTLFLTACGGKDNSNTIEMKNPASNQEGDSNLSTTDESPNADQSTQEIDAEQALSIALGHADLTEQELKTKRVKEETEDGQKIFEVEFVSNTGVEYDYEISALEGTIFSFSYDAEHTVERTKVSGGEVVSEDQVKQKVLEYLPEAAAEEIQIVLKEDDGWMEYEAYVFYNDMSNEFKIDAGSGNILEWEGELPGY